MLGATRNGVTQGEIIRLSIQYFDQAKNYVDPPAPPSISIIDPTNAVILNADVNSGITRQDMGLYYFDFTVPASGILGIWHDVWSVKVGNIPFNKMLEFTVNELINPITAEAGQEIDPQLSQEGIKNVLLLMKLLRTRLGSDGVRRKRDAFGRYLTDSSGNYILEPCNVFTTDELYTFLKAALAEFNSVPHFTGFTFNDTAFVNTFQHELTEGAFIMALALQGLREKGREFQITDDGLSYQPPLIADYLKGYLGDFLNNYRERLKFIKCSMKPGPKGFGAWSFTNTSSPAVLRLRHLRSRQVI